MTKSKKKVSSEKQAPILNNFEDGFRLGVQDLANVLVKQYYPHRNCCMDKEFASKTVGCFVGIDNNMPEECKKGYQLAVNCFRAAVYEDYDSLYPALICYWHKNNKEQADDEILLKYLGKWCDYFASGLYGIHSYIIPSSISEPEPSVHSVSKKPSFSFKSPF